MDLGKMREVIRAFRNGASIGDVAVMKFDALRPPPEEINALLGDVEGYAPALELASLDQQPEGSLGAEYARFLRRHELQHLTVSPDLLDRFRDNPYAVRYTVTHDLHHLLTGFDTGLAGEVGVVGFTVGQGTAPMGPLGMRVVRYLYPWISPSQAAATRHNYDLGVQMGERAKLVLAEPLESWLADPLPEVRVRLGIDEALIAKVEPSGRSWVAEKMYASANRLPDAGVVHG